jgi:hypothetical protein
MDRSRIPSAQTVARASVGSLLASGLFFVVLSVSGTTACDSVDTVPAPDAAQPPCDRGPFTFFCQPPAAGEPSCNTQNGTSPVLSRLPQNTAYSVGCVVNFVGARDDQGDCRLEAVCKCVIGEVPIATTDASVPQPAPNDAGDDAEAGAEPQPPPPPPSPTGPVWLCDPP